MRKIIIAILTLGILATLCGCAIGTRKPSGLYRDDDNLLTSHPDDNMLWKDKVIVQGNGDEWKYTLKGDKLELIDPYNGEKWTCKIEFISGTDIYELSDYDYDREMYCPFWDTYYRYK